jgi:hypothetical protein
VVNQEAQLKMHSKTRPDVSEVSDFPFLGVSMYVAMTGFKFVAFSLFEQVVATRWFKYNRDYLCVNKSQFVPVMFEPHCKIVKK